MSNILPFLVMTAAQAARFREETVGDANRLEPRAVDAGPHVGKYVIPRRVMDDPAFAERQDALLMLPEIALDTELAWPEIPE